MLSYTVINILTIFNSFTSEAMLTNIEMTFVTFANRNQQIVLERQG